MEETVLVNTSDSGDALDVLATAFMQEHLSCWISELDDNDPDWSEKRCHLNKYMHAWVNHRPINGNRGRVIVGVRNAETELVGCMTVAPSCCAKERLLDTLVNIVKLGSPPMAKHKGKYVLGSSMTLADWAIAQFLFTLSLNEACVEQHIMVAVIAKHPVFEAWLNHMMSFVKDWWNQQPPRGG